MAKSEKATPSKSGKNADKAAGSKNRKPIVIGSIIGGVIIVAAVVVLLVARSAGKDPVTFDYANLPASETFRPL